MQGARICDSGGSAHCLCPDSPVSQLPLFDMCVYTYIHQQSGVTIILELHRPRPSLASYTRHQGVGSALAILL